MGASKVTSARGFRDYLPSEKARRESLLTEIREAYGHFGYREIETPAVEPLSRLRASDGGDNVGMIFEILRRGLSATDVAAAETPHELCDLGLRYDLTVPLARFYATARDRLPTVLRTIQIGPVWRAERPQKGRFRQFMQCDIDVIGEPQAVAEIELIVATLHAIRRIGLSEAVVRLNDRRLLGVLLESTGVPDALRATALVTIDKLDKVGIDGVKRQLVELGIDKPAPALGAYLEACVDTSITLDDFGELVGTALPNDVAADHLTILEGVRTIAGERSIRFDPTLVRGLGYYTGPIFEIDHPASGKSVGGGGRYDGMIGRFLDQAVPACGFSLGFDRIADLLHSEISTSDPMRVALVYPADAAPQDIVERQVQLIDNGYKVTLVREARNMRRVFDEIAAAGCASFQRLRSQPDDFRPLPGEVNATA